ncbi:hypothetical protein AAY473_027307 [Plecturocebus cupreus]
MKSSSKPTKEAVEQWEEVLFTSRGPTALPVTLHAPRIRAHLPKTFRTPLCHFGRPKRVDHLKSGVRDQPDQYGEIPSLLKLQKLSRHGGMCLSSQLLNRLRQENCLNLGGQNSTSIAIVTHPIKDGCSEGRLGGQHNAELGTTLIPEYLHPGCHGSVLSIVFGDVTHINSLISTVNSNSGSPRGRCKEGEHLDFVPRIDEARLTK